MLERYKVIWKKIRKKYNKGFVTTEATLQALLFEKLGKEKGVDVVAEPTWWINNARKNPDLVVVQNREITDILELKLEFYPKYKDNIDKLCLYAQNCDSQISARLDPNTMQQKKGIPISDSCRLHFVAIARHDAYAIDPGTVQTRFYDGLPEELQTNRRLYHWLGPVSGSGDNNWDVRIRALHESGSACLPTRC